MMRSLRVLRAENRTRIFTLRRLSTAAPPQVGCPAGQCRCRSGRRRHLKGGISNVRQRQISLKW